MTIGAHALSFFSNRLRRWIELAAAEPTLTEVMYQHGETAIDVAGELHLVEDSDLDDAAILSLGGLVASHADTVWSRDRPFLSAVLGEGWRVSFTRPPLTPSGPTMSLRKLMRRAVPLERYVADGIMTEADAEHLKQLVRTRRNVVISGATGSGKTTLLRCLLELVDREDRIVSLEEARELALTDETGERPRRHWVALEAQPGLVGMDACLRAALRLRPDRIIVGEVRGTEALELIRALNTGHRGMITSLHSNGRAEAFERLHSLVAETQPTFDPAIIRRCIDAVVQISGMGARRKVDEIWEPSR